MIERGDHSLVYAEKYPRASRFLASPSEHTETIDLERSRVEKDPELMNRLTAAAYPEEKDGAATVVFKYTGASVNEGEGELLLWYMGSFRDPDVYAGYRLQWIFDLDKERLTGVYVSMVPLE